MKIDSPNRNKIIVELSTDDMESLDITYDQLDYSNIETRRVIWTILAKVRKKTGRDIDPSGKIVIETLPSKEGGCMIFFTVIDKANEKHLQLPLKTTHNNSVYEFKNIDDLIELCNFFIKDGKRFSCEVYSDNKGKYRIITDSTENFAEMRIHINEFASFCGSDDYISSFTREYWHLESSDILCS